MMKLPAFITFLPRTISSLTRNYAIVRKDAIAEVIKVTEALMSMSSGDDWTSASEVSLSGDRRWKLAKQNTLSAWAADPAVARAVSIYARWCLAGGVRITKYNERAWAAATIKRLFPNGLFQFVMDYVFHYFVYGELYFRPIFNSLGIIDRFEFISPIEVLDVRQDAATRIIYFTRRWADEQVSIANDGETLDRTPTYNQRAYSSEEICIIKWNSTDNRGMPFLYPIIVWAAMYAEWLKDRAVANNMRSFAYLKHKINQPPGTAKVKADQLSSQMMRTGSYVAGRSDQFGYGIKKQKMPKGGILTYGMDEDWDALNFQVGGDDAAPDGHAIRQQICALTGIPEALLFTDDTAKLDISDARVESFSRDIEFVRSMLNFHLDGILAHCRRRELLMQGRITTRTISTQAGLQFKPAAVGERRFYTDDAVKAFSSGQISRRTAMEMNPNVIDPDIEEARIREERNDGITEEFLDRVAAIKSNRDDEDTDLKNKQKEKMSGKRKQEYDQTKKTGAEE